MIDREGYRANVGIVLCNDQARLLWARRIGQDAWQFPQGGMQEQESPEQAMFRELREEIGLSAGDVQLIGRTRDWLRYRLPGRMVRHHQQPVCIGQKQIWFLLRLTGDETCVSFDSTNQPEFDHWRWVNYWRPMREVVSFKRGVYARVLREFAPLVLPAQRRVSARSFVINPPNRLVSE
ncbi:MAG: RNA pyrophosphohydrolase [Gammaproteobacteria bacterium]|nr:RNA pyrophosphohydrolase [Gammaproteobacteria bacterium]